MHFTQLPLGEQIFTHIDPETKKETVFAVDRIRAAIAVFGDKYLENCPILARQAKMIQKYRGIEPARLRRALKTKDYLPLIFLAMPDETGLLIDGSHSYLAMYMKGITETKAYLIEQPIWKLFTVEGLPPYGSEEELLSTHSGIKI